MVDCRVRMPHEPLPKLAEDERDHVAFIHLIMSHVRPDLAEQLLKDKLFPGFFQANDSNYVNHTRMEQITSLLSLRCNNEAHEELLCFLRQWHNKHHLDEMSYYLNVQPQTPPGHPPGVAAPVNLSPSPDGEITNLMKAMVASMTSMVDQQKVSQAQQQQI